MSFERSFSIEYHELRRLAVLSRIAGKKGDALPAKLEDAVKCLEGRRRADCMITVEDRG